MNTNDIKMTDLLELLVQPKPNVFTSPENPVLEWKKIWATALNELPTMWKRNEEWFYFHWGTKSVMAGTNTQVQTEFESLRRQGLVKADDTSVNEKGIYAILIHPKKKKMGLRCEFTFERYAKKNGLAMCPLLWGIGSMGDGFTYVRVRFTEVELSKDKVKLAMDLVNGKFERI